MKHDSKLELLSFWAGAFNSAGGSAYIDLQWRSELLRLARNAQNDGFCDYERLYHAMMADNAVIMERTHPVNQIMLNWLKGNREGFPVEYHHCLDNILAHYKEGDL